MNRILASLKENLFTTGKVIALAAICLISGFLISYPFWKFAVLSPKVYTFCALSLIALGIVYYLVKAFHSMSRRKAIRTILKAVIIVFGAAGTVVLVINEYRVFALLVLIAILALIFTVNLLLYEKKTD